MFNTSMFTGRNACTVEGYSHLKYAIYNRQNNDSHQTIYEERVNATCKYTKYRIELSNFIPCNGFFIHRSTFW